MSLKKCPFSCCAIHPLDTLHPPSLRRSEWWSSLLPDNFVSRRSISPCEYFLTMFFHGEALLAPRPTPKLEDHPSLAVRDCLFNIFTAPLHIGGRSSIRNLRTRRAVVTGTHLSRERYNLYTWISPLSCVVDPPTKLIIRKFSDSKFRRSNSIVCFLRAIFPNQVQSHWPTEEVRLEEHSNKSGWCYLSLLPKFLVFLFFAA